NCKHKMAEDLLPLLGVNMGNEGESEDDSSDSNAYDVNPDDIDMQIVNYDNPVDNIHQNPGAEQNPDVQNNPDASGDNKAKKEKKSKKKKKTKKRDMTFDRSLPVEHSYLGADMEDIRGRTVLDDDSYTSLPILCLPGVVLIPGQTVPLHIFQPATVSMINRVISQDKTFGMINVRYDQDFTAVLADVGTTAEIFSAKEETDELSGITTVRVKAMGRQRFKVKETRRQLDGILIAQVYILSEAEVCDPLGGAIPPSHRKFCSSKTIIKPQDQVAVDAHGQYFQYSTKTKKPQINRFSSAHLTWWPPWVYKQFDVSGIMEKLKDELRSWNETIREENMPCDPTDFSFWVAGNAPLDDGMKLQLLTIDSTIQRLRCELSIMQRCTILCCKDCGRQITNKKEVFSMTLQGPMAAYVNPGGHVHETLTVYKAQNLSMVGGPSTEHSWFPGYAWTIVQCAHCHTHMGWKFTATKKKLKPDKFWGITRSALLPGLENDDTSDSPWVPLM
ncbi:unnamed protein product, partial [Owenia fusiformis]